LLEEQLQQRTAQIYTQSGQAELTSFVADLTLAEHRLGVDGPEGLRREFDAVDKRLFLYRPLNVLMVVEPMMEISSAYIGASAALGTLTATELYEGFIECAKVGFIVGYENEKQNWMPGRVKKAPFWQRIVNPTASQLRTITDASISLSLSIEEAARTNRRKRPWEAEARLSLYLTGQFKALTMHPNPTATIRRIPEILTLKAGFVVGHSTAIGDWPPGPPDDAEARWLSSALSKMAVQGEQALVNWSG
jgi:hypothetical protein